MSRIEWTDRTWNPSIGCAKVSAGCKHCYAEKMAGRIARMQKRSPYLRVLGIDTQSCVPVEEEDVSSQWNGRAVFLPERLREPLSWRTPSRIFVDSMSDLFHEDITNAQIAAVFGIMAATPHHTYQVLTKRPARMLEWFRWVESRGRDGLRMFPEDPEAWRIGQMLAVSLSQIVVSDRRLRMHGGHGFDPRNQPWPLPNVHLGVSVEHQKAYNERVPLLLQCPAALHFISMEPLLEPIRMTAIELPRIGDTVDTLNPLTGHIDSPGWSMMPALGWVIVGGESGPGARPCMIRWIECVVEQCFEAGVPVFVKQLGATPAFDANGRNLVKDRKGGNPDEWPEHLRVRQMPLTDDELRELGAAFMEYDDAQR